MFAPRDAAAAVLAGAASGAGMEVGGGVAGAGAGTSAFSCKLFLPRPPNRLLGGAVVKSSPPGKFGMPAKGLLGVLLATLLRPGLLSEDDGGGGALWGSGEVSGLAA